ncbi:MAG: hypothetical protein H8E41_01190 [Desulfobulbaceae bacterium]|uniref:Uncharacterized protein n=1 Tax=Candidatus Desulfobia pelagia TaxID=2841692 RepID=A0A8J6TAK9_9BACT|nr:hypothetical protein [Candidatus Desulfobia pelagia]
MSDVAVVECWKLTDCQRADDCLVSQYSGMACWEVARIQQDCDDVLSACEDCLVYITVTRKNTGNLTEEEIQSIWEKKGKCELFPKCIDCDEE